MASLRVSFKCDGSHVAGPADAASEIPAEHTWVDHLVDAVSVVSFTPGRVRFRLDFQGDEMLSDTLRRELHKLPSVRLQSYSVRTRTALVTFDPDETGPVGVTTAILRSVREFARTHGDCDLEDHRHERAGRAHAHEPGEDCDHDHAVVTDASIRKELLKMTATGLLLGYFVYKRVKAAPLAAAAISSPLGLASFVTIVSGYPIFRGGLKAVQKKKKPTDDTLISIAVLASVASGESLTGLSVVWLIQLGRLLEMITLKRSRTAVKELMDITPTEAWLVVKTDSAKDAPAVTRRTPVEKFEKGDIIRAFHGDKVALDGKIVRGKALMRESFLTGESIPREKKAGDTVYAGSVVEAGEIDVEVTSLVHDTVVATMIDAIENLRDRKAPIEKVGTRFAGKFVPISIGLSVVTLLATRDLRRAITMLVIACPCAAGLATPTAVSSTIGQVARKGILIKGGAHLETAARVDTVIFDKTGTLTLGAPVLEHYFVTAKGKKLGADECLRLAASAEQVTTHPLGRALIAGAKKRSLKLEAISDYMLHEGLGIEAMVGERHVLIGSRRFMDSSAIEIPKSVESASLHDFRAGGSLLYLSVDNVLQGVYVVEDRIRPEAKRMLARLRELGIERFLLATGDQKVAAEHVANQLGITEVHSALLPEDKLALVKRLKSAGRRVAMMGDGVNDAQALTEADLSIAMGAGRCDVAIETSDVTIARDDLMLVADLFDASRKTLHTIYQNFVAAVGINAGGLVYSAMGQLSLFSAAIVHNASTIAVVVNSLRLGKAVSGQNPLGLLKEVKV